MRFTYHSELKYFGSTAFINDKFERLFTVLSSIEPSAPPPCKHEHSVRKALDITSNCRLLGN